MGFAVAGLGLWASSGCGQKGALYLPDAPPQAVTTPAQTPPSDPASARRKTPPAPDPATTE
jgi:predicted small lipoprotein YifL